jgi:hypothetical protein
MMSEFPLKRRNFHEIGACALNTDNLFLHALNLS